MPVEVDNDVNLAAIAEQHAGAALGSEDFVLLWAEEGVGAAIVIDGRLHRGATGGAGEVGFLPLPGTPLVRKVGVNNAGGFQELAGAKAVLGLARGHGVRAATAEGAVAAATRAARRRRPFLSTSSGTGSPSVSRPSSRARSGAGRSSPAASSAPAANGCSTWCAGVADLAVCRAPDRLSGVPDDRCCSGACTPRSGRPATSSSTPHDPASRRQDRRRVTSKHRSDRT